MIAYHWHIRVYGGGLKALDYRYRSLPDFFDVFGDILDDHASEEGEADHLRRYLALASCTRGTCTLDDEDPPAWAATC